MIPQVDVTLAIVSREWLHGAGAVDECSTPRVYNELMARGWESKSVEEQQAAAQTKVESKQRLTAEQSTRKQAREAIELSRRRVLQQLQSVHNPRHREMLESALSELNARLTRLG